MEDEKCIVTGEKAPGVQCKQGGHMYVRCINYKNSNIGKLQSTEDDIRKNMKTYLKSPCGFDEETGGRCGYKWVSILGCGKNKKVKKPEDCHHYNCMVTIGLYEPSDHKM